MPKNEEGWQKVFEHFNSEHTYKKSFCSKKLVKLDYKNMEMQ